MARGMERALTRNSTLQQLYLTPGIHSAFLLICTTILPSKFWLSYYIIYILGSVCGIILATANNITKAKDFVCSNSKKAYLVSGEHSFCFLFRVFESSSNERILLNKLSSMTIDKLYSIHPQRAFLLIQSLPLHKTLTFRNIITYYNYCTKPE